MSDGTWDMGNDGKTTGSIIARDAYGFSLNYFANDYTPIGVTNPFAGITIASDLYNGNIKAMTVNIPKLGDALTYGYKYDQLNRLTAMNVYKGLNNTTNVFTPIAINDYKEKVSYDPNGNILTYKRNGDAARSNSSITGMDNLSYTYKPGTNQLDKVTDASYDAAAGEYDKYKDIKQGQTNGNYQYDAIGNLISDASEGITNISWNVYGKIKSITKSNGTNIQYTYDASGNRISKIVNGNETWYIRDASGNVMSIYSKDAAINNNHLTQSEIHLYGSSRLGVYNLSNDVENPDLNPARVFIFKRGIKFFELSNHLGNVLATVSDKRFGKDGNSDGFIDYYTSEVVNANDYYPFGMMMPGRKYSAANTQYRYGFNGKELDKEVSATTTYDYGFRIYSPALGKFLSVDPLTKKFPELTPYQFASNSPIWNIDLDGLEGSRYTDPKQILYKAGGDISDAMGNFADKFSTKFEAGYTYLKNLFSDENSTVSIEKKTTFSAGLSTNVGNYLDYVKTHNSSEGAPPLFDFSFEKTQSISIITNEQLGPISLKSTLTLDSKGISKEKFTGTFSSSFAGLPADFSLSTSKSSSLEKTFSQGFTLKSSKFFKLPFSFDYSQKESGARKIESKSGVEIQIGDKSGIKLFSNANFGISF